MALIEAQAHILQNFYNELGISYNGNLKRERINTAETDLMEGSLDFNVYNIIETLKAGIEKVNKKFGTDIVVKLNEVVIENDEPLDNSDFSDGIEEPKIEEEETEEKTEVKEEVTTE